MYVDDDMLMLSGIQHYVFCPRQWALIHLEQQWEDNRLTSEGEILHKNADNPFYRQKNGGRITLRSVSIASKELGLYGVTDAVELIPTSDAANSIIHQKYPGYWLPYPVEYKHGRRKRNSCDELQLAAQVMCLEEMYGITISRAALFYWETREREEVEITRELRELTKEAAEGMHRIFRFNTTPAAAKKKCCKSCSLQNLCMPELAECVSVENYLKRNLYAETT